VGWAAAAAALSSARMGQFDEVDALAERAIAAGHPGLLRFTSGFGQTTALVMAGELDRAKRWASSSPTLLSCSSLAARSVKYWLPTC